MPTKLPKKSFNRASFPQGSLARNQILVPHLEAFDNWEQEWDFHMEPKIHDDAWHPSSDCTPTAHELWAARVDGHEPWKPRPALQRTFMVGHFWHQVLQKVVVDLGLAKPEDIERVGVKGWRAAGDGKAWLTDPTITYQPYHWIRGQADICPLVCGAWSGLVDIKTMNTSDFTESERGGLLPLRFADKYEAQINVYMDLHDQEQALILGVNKDSSKFIEFRFERNQPLIDAIYTKWEHVGDCIKEGVEPWEEPELPFKGPIQ